MSYKDVALFIPSLHSGGAERAIVNLACGFIGKGLSVDLILSRTEGPYLSQVPLPVRIIDLKASRILWSIPKLVHYFQKEQPKVLISALNHANIAALWASKIACVPTRVFVNVQNMLSIITARSKNVCDRLMPLLTRIFYPMADKVIAISQGVANDLVRFIGLPRERIIVIYNPVVTPEIFIKAEEPLNHPWFRPGEPPVILGVGRLTEQKDFPTLICAFAFVRKKRLARLLILGEGEDRLKLEALVRKLRFEKDIALPGFTENPYKYMKKATVFVLSSQWEGLSNVLIEAMALGTPVVSTNCPSGPSEVLEGGRWGRLVPIAQPEALANAILETIDNPPPPPPREAWKRFLLSEVIDTYLRILF